MAWNEPGGGNKDPWSGGGDQGPPDLDEVVRKLQERLGGLFGGKGGGQGGPSGGPGRDLSLRLIGVAVAVLVVIWLATGIYIVGPAERGVETRFGKLTETTGPGPHWHIPAPIESVTKVNVDEIATFSHKASMLTQDENIVDVELTVQSRIQDAANYLFQDQNPEKTLRDATVTVVRVTIGGSKLDYVMTEGRSAVAVTIKERIQALMDQYKTGLEVTTINMQPAKPPEQVKAAFDDAIKAREDKERIENQAEAYANEVLPRARGEAARIIADARAYRDKVIAESEGEAARFSAILAEYQKAPEVTRERLYLETMEQVLGGNAKVLLDVKDGGNSLMYLPIDQMLKQSATPAQSGPAASAPVAATPASATGASDSTPQRIVDRERRTR
ncbi:MULTISPECIES: FtsH protease activity modulator HflK [Marichromatium]|uniref:Protein HflK n=1 Tax=Marichromatium gracile TaxID=1048 RepID=A0A4R4AB48_MARGR|nr:MULTISPECIES: FtsH protease activity modulator HflK [Marichromatium]MBK1708168.1 FtsH protease activity modulator HflK [Marichromatium gracile]RNE89596.1 FtsH protease activity modulator HflK [Marichromatium sp. AB31]RNE94675.1 FtsH protease activity modulator HflK [Marichromatium sp. AB32]TCW35849.1 protease FtsH subunit HflK [Marichromatium gracile]